MSKTKIEWTRDAEGNPGATWNPVLGCSKISPGCRGCYAISHVHRMAGNPNAKVAAANAGLTIIEGGRPNWTGQVRLIPERLTIPARTRKPTTYFVNSLSDLFHEDLPSESIDAVMAAILMAQRHRYQILTKRSHRLLQYFRDTASLRDRLYDALLDPRLWPELWGDRRRAVLGMPSRAGVAEGLRNGWREVLPKNVWLGVSVESRDYLSRIDHLRGIPAAVRFLSLEPLLEDLGQLDLTGINWVIVGGESGPCAHPCDLAWIRSIIAQCKAAGVPCFVKQLGANPEDCSRMIQVFCDGGPVPASVQGITKKGGDPSEWPEDLRVREMPEVSA